MKYARWRWCERCRRKILSHRDKLCSTPIPLRINTVLTPYQGRINTVLTGRQLADNSQIPSGFVLGWGRQRGVIGEG